MYKPVRSDFQFVQGRLLQLIDRDSTLLRPFQSRRDSAREAARTGPRFRLPKNMQGFRGKVKQTWVGKLDDQEQQQVQSLL
jgi:hypothetical protein